MSAPALPPTPGAPALIAALEATWPAARTWSHGPVTLRDGAGGGSRVSAATAPGPVGAAVIAGAAQAMRAIGQTPLWRLHAGDPGQQALDAELAAAGYLHRDETIFMAAPAPMLAARPLDVMSAFRAWPPLAIQREIWDDGGIGPTRRAVMDRATPPKATLMGRVGEFPAGTAFVALHDGIAMIHAIEVQARFRRQGLARNMIIAAARWTVEQGGDTLALAVTARNVAARSLYHTMGFDRRAAYHYRVRED